MTTLLEPEVQEDVPVESVPTYIAGAHGCEWGQGRCEGRAELEVQLPATNDRRLMCPPHAGYYMLAATSSHRVSVVRVRQVAPGATRQNTETAASR